MVTESDDECSCSFNFLRGTFYFAGCAENAGTHEEEESRNTEIHGRQRNILGRIQSIDIQCLITNRLGACLHGGRVACIGSW